jgi:hypothetical protein
MATITEIPWKHAQAGDAVHYQGLLTSGLKLAFYDAPLVKVRRNHVVVKDRGEGRHVSPHRVYSDKIVRVTRASDLIQGSTAHAPWTPQPRRVVSR